MKKLLLLLLIPIMSCGPATLRLEEHPFVVNGMSDSSLDGMCYYSGKGYFLTIICPCVYHLGDTIKLNR